jgi:hypothetical protein
MEDTGGRRRDGMELAVGMGDGSDFALVSVEKRTKE